MIFQQTNNISTDDHDLVPDEGQEKEPAIPSQKSGLPRNGFKPSATSTVKPKEEESPIKRLEEHLEKKSEEKKEQDWTKIDLRHGTIKKGIFGSRRSFIAHEKKDLRHLKTIFDAEQRAQIAAELANLRKHGLGRGEVRKKINEMRKSGVLKSKFEAKKLRRELGATKSSSWF